MEKGNDWEGGDILDKMVWEGFSEDMTCKETPK